MSYKKPQNKRALNCLNCGEDISHRSFQTKYCSNACRPKYAYDPLKNSRPQGATAAPIIRKCLGCGNSFESEWVGNRVCYNCKQGSAWERNYL